LLQSNGIAIRFTVGVGAEHFFWDGLAVINDQAGWPDWYPPAEMLARRRKLHVDMRLHSTNEP